MRDPQTTPLQRWSARIETGVAALVLPLCALLFLQWPLRDLIGWGSREANDLGQIIFALYMAVAVTAASRQQAHLSPGAAPRLLKSRKLRNRVLLLLTAPWAVFLLWSSAAPVWQSLRQLERFGETFNPGYFLVKLSLWILAALVLFQAVRDCLHPAGSTDD